MERMLLKIARQLNGMDEASLMALWPKYLERVQNFDGSQEWEDASIVLSLLHAVKSKNQLFNAKLAERQELPGETIYTAEDLHPWRNSSRRHPGLDDDRIGRGMPRKKEEHASKPANILQFKPKN